MHILNQLLLVFYQLMDISYFHTPLYYIFTIIHYKENAKLLLKKAYPLIDIYNEKKLKEFNKLIINNSKITGNRRNIYTNLPIYTIDNKLLNKILNKNNISKEEQKKIINSINE